MFASEKKKTYLFLLNPIHQYVYSYMNKFPSIDRQGKYGLYNIVVAAADVKSMCKILFGL